MRIAVIGAKKVPSRNGGIDVVVDKLCSCLQKQGHTIDIFVRRQRGYKPPKYYNGCRIKRVFTLNFKSLGALIYSFLLL